MKESLAALRSKFIVIEGTDGAGTTLQTDMLCELLNESGVPAVKTREPTYHLHVGKLIRSFITKEHPAPSWEVMALLFAADRLDHCHEIKERMAQGFTVVSDRYYLSSFIYQTLTSGGEPYAKLTWIQQLNLRALRPDKTLVISVTAAVAGARRQARDGAKEELFEAAELQERVCAAYNEPSRWMNDPYVMIDGAKTPEEVALSIQMALLTGAGV